MRARAISVLYLHCLVQAQVHADNSYITPSHTAHKDPHDPFKQEVIDKYLLKKGIPTTQGRVGDGWQNAL